MRRPSTAEGEEPGGHQRKGREIVCVLGGWDCGVQDDQRETRRGNGYLALSLQLTLLLRTPLVLTFSFLTISCHPSTTSTSVSSLRKTLCVIFIRCVLHSGSCSPGWAGVTAQPGVTFPISGTAP